MIKKLTIISIFIFVSSCSLSNYQPISTVDQVDINRFMGDWYVIANIPTFIEEGAHNAVENYALNQDGSIATTFTFRSDSFDGDLKTYEPTGFIEPDTGNAVWGMQFIWPIKAEYRVIYLDQDYRVTIIGRSARDYVWLMARTPEIEQAELDQLIKFIVDQGYDKSKINIVPQNWKSTLSNDVQTQLLIDDLPRSVRL